MCPSSSICSRQAPISARSITALAACPEGSEGVLGSRASRLTAGTEVTDGRLRRNSGLSTRFTRNEVTLSDASIAALYTHNWPGNVRELENAIERACILADGAQLEPRDLGLINEEVRDPKAFGFDISGTLSEAAERAVKMIEQQKIADALASHDGNKTRVAEALGVSYKTLLTKIKDYNL